MPNGSNGNTATSSADTAARLYPDTNDSQPQDTTTPASGGFKPGPAYVVTNMTEGKTIFVDPNTGKSFEMETRNAIDSKSRNGADDPYSGNITGVFHPQTEDEKKKFGWAMITTDDKRHRFIHGGGSNPDLAPNPDAARQGWVPTLGCTRAQNEDIKKMANMVQQFKKDHPKVPILYYRVRPDAQDE